MNSFLVLGQIPGTNFQISFSAWLNIAGILVAAMIINIATRNYRGGRVTIAEPAHRQAPHASQLHQRAQ